MLGSILGDIVGSTFEFSNTRDYNFEMFPNGSNYTDDSVLTLPWLTLRFTERITGRQFTIGQ